MFMAAMLATGNVASAHEGEDGHSHDEEAAAQAAPADGAAKGPRDRAPPAPGDGSGRLGR